MLEYASRSLRWPLQSQSAISEGGVLPREVPATVQQGAIRKFAVHEGSVVENNGGASFILAFNELHVEFFLR